jgi:muramoyltetrapeptide carboxypeptidase
MIVPPFLKTDDVVCIVAPAGRVKEDALNVPIKILQGNGLKVILGKHVYSNSHTYLAATDEERLFDLQAAVDNPSVKAIFCARGGYGTTRILDRVNFDPLIQNPKWIVGFSDVTSLHLRLSNLGYESIHGIMPVLFTKPNSADSTESLINLLFGKPSDFSIEPSPFNKLGKNRGELVGGNLSLIVDSIGTTSEPETNGKILVLEEIDEYRYKVDRMMTHLKRAGKLSSLSGLIVGHMTGISDDDTFNDSVEEIILGKVTEFDYPVIFGFPTGHDFPNLAWRSGARVELNATEHRVTLTYESTFR